MTCKTSEWTRFTARHVTNKLYFVLVFWIWDLLPPPALGLEQIVNDALSRGCVWMLIWGIAHDANRLINEPSHALKTLVTGPSVVPVGRVATLVIGGVTLVTQPGGLKTTQNWSLPPPPLNEPDSIQQLGFCEGKQLNSPKVACFLSRHHCIQVHSDDINFYIFYSEIICVAEWLFKVYSYRVEPTFHLARHVKSRHDT